MGEVVVIELHIFINPSPSTKDSITFVILSLLASNFEISAWCRKFCPTKHFVRRKFCPKFQYKSQIKNGQNCRNFGLVSNILSDEIFCPSKILSDETLSDKVS